MGKSRLFVAAITFALLAAMVLGCTGANLTPTPTPEPQFEFSNLQIVKPASYVELSQVLLGDQFDVSVDVENIGDTGGTYTVTLKVDGVAKMTKEVTLEAKASQGIRFRLTEELGTHTITVDGLTTTFEVTREWRVTVVSVKKLMSLELRTGGTITPLKIGNYFLVVEIKFENMRTGEGYEFVSEWVTLSDSGGNSYLPVACRFDNSQWYEGEWVTAVVTITTSRPGIMTGSFAYVVTPDAEGLTLEFLDCPPISLG